MDPVPVTLEGEMVRLEPLSRRHIGALTKVGLDAAIWQLNPRAIATPEDLASYVEQALEEEARSVSLPFAIVLREGDTAIGSTRYGNIDRANKRLEIGWTWIGRDWWRTGVNTECKLLLLTHAFDVLGCARVELKTDALNHRSRNAILRIGAKQEGTLRKHMLTSSGRWRDTVYYSILDDEWPDVRSRLDGMRARYA